MQRTINTGMLTMSDVAEGIGALAEGSFAARAVEPQRGENGELAKPEDACANCGYSGPSGAFCPQCGQKMHVHRTLSAIGHDLLHGVLHLDGKFWNTLPLLVFKPGQLTRRYIEGERAKFVSPMAMFLFSVFAMFAIFQMVGLTTPTTLDMGDPVEAVRAEGEQELARLTQEIEATSLDDPARAELERSRAALEELIERSVINSITPTQTNEETSDTQSNPTSEFLEGFAQAIEDGDDGDLEVNLTGFDSLDQGLIKKWRENPGLMLYKLQANAYKFSWLLIPFSIPFVWLTFAWRRQFKAYDHAIFVTYSLSFMSLLFITVSLLNTVQAVAWLGGVLMFCVPPLHLYKQLRGAYGLRRFSAIWRLLVLSAFIWIVIGLFLQALFLLGAF